MNLLFRLSAPNLDDYMPSLKTVGIPTLIITGIVFIIVAILIYKFQGTNLDESIFPIMWALFIVCFIGAVSMMIVSCHMTDTKSYKRDKELYQTRLSCGTKEISFVQVNNNTITISCADGQVIQDELANVRIGDEAQVVVWYDAYCQDEHYDYATITKELAEQFGISVIT